MKRAIENCKKDLAQKNPTGSAKFNAAENVQELSFELIEAILISDAHYISDSDDHLTPEVANVQSELRDILKEASSQHVVQRLVLRRSRFPPQW